MLQRIGQILREAREAKGLSLTDIQMETNIRRGFLEALEAGADHDAFPGVPYHRGFLKCYARAVGVPAETVLKLYDEHYTPAPEKVEGKEGERGAVKSTPAATRETAAAAVVTAVPVPVPVPTRRPAAPPNTPRRSPGPSRPRAAARDSGKRSAVVLGVIALVVVVSASAWFLLNQPTSPAASLGGQPGTQPGTMPGTQPPTPPATPKVSVTRREVDPDTVAFDVKGADKVTVAVKVNAACWFGVTQDGEPIAEETLRPGDTRTWSASDKLLLRVGNPGGATLTVNGEDKGAMGEVGMPKTILIQKAP